MTSLLGLFLFTMVSILLWRIIIHVKIITLIKEANLRKQVLPILNDDIKRVWDSFFESYLFTYAHSRVVPNEKEFKEFRQYFFDMFSAIVGINQTKSYVEIFKGEDPFKRYIFSSFEKHFKSVFVELMIDKNVLNIENKIPKGE